MPSGHRFDSALSVRQVLLQFITARLELHDELRRVFESLTCRRLRCFELLGEFVAFRFGAIACGARFA